MSSENYEITVTEGSGNVFADLGFADAEEMMVKGQIAFIISNIIERRGLSQTQAARILKVDQPKVSALVHGRLDGFSLERLLHFLLALDRDVEIAIKPKAETQRAGRLDVVAVGE